MLKKYHAGLADYKIFFALTAEDLNKDIVEFGAGCNSFNAELTKLQHKIISCDPLYQATLEQLKKQVPNTPVTEVFFADYVQGTKEQRYRPFTLHDHTFGQQQFDLLLAHYLFVEENLSLEILLSHIQSGLQIANEMRIFPLLDGQRQHSPFIAPILLALQQQGHGVELKKVDFEQQEGGHVLLTIKLQSCLL